MRALHSKAAVEAAVAVAVLALSATGCGPGGNGGSGDAPSKPPANPYGTGSRVADILGPATWEDISNLESTQCTGVPGEQQVRVTGAAVTAIDRFDETGGGADGNYYVQDALAEPIAFSGVTVFDPGFSPPDLRVVEGDVMDIFGLLSEFPGPGVGPFNYCRTLPELSGAMEFRFEGGNVPPVRLDVSELATYESARQWLGMLVEIENVPLLEDPYEAGGRYSIRIDTGTPPSDLEEIPAMVNELMDLKAAYPDMMQGQVLTRVRGIVTYFYGVHLAPRYPKDVEL